jgi:hypothetical protein
LGFFACLGGLISLIGSKRKLIIRSWRMIATFTKVEKCIKDSAKEDRLLYAGNNLEKSTKAVCRRS